MRRLVIVAFAVLCLGAPAAAQADGPQRGLQMPTLTGETPTRFLLQELGAAEDLHAKLVRTELFWNKLEPKASGERDATYLAQVDAFMAAAHAAGIKVLLTLDDTPCWASTNTDCSKAAGFPPRNPNDYAEVAGYVANRWGRDLAAIEVWNEPDHKGQFYFGGPDKPQRYAAILKAAYPAIKRASPSTKVLAGSLVGANGEFLTALYAQGIKGSYDAISVHYYDLVLASLRAIRQVQLKHGDHKPLWLAEFGWTSCFPARTTEGGHSCVSPAVQAQNLRDIYAALRTTSWVDAAVVYTLRDDATYKFGLIGEDGTRKPSYTTMGSVFASGAGRLRGVTLGLKVVGGCPASKLSSGKVIPGGSCVVAAGGASAGDVLQVTARGHGLTFKGTFRLDRDDQFSLRLPTALGTHGVKVKVLQFWSGRSATRSL